MTFLADFKSVRPLKACLSVAYCRWSRGACRMWPTPSVSGTAPGAYDGTWNVLFTTQAGNCSSNNSIPFTVAGRRFRRPAAARSPAAISRQAVSWPFTFGRRFGGRRQRPACRQFRRRPLERHHFRRPVQRHLAGDAQLIKKTARQIIWRAVSKSAEQQAESSDQRGASTITTWRPSKRASCSTLAISATSLLTLSSSLVPISWCAISRPR